MYIYIYIYIFIYNIYIYIYICNIYIYIYIYNIYIYIYIRFVLLLLFLHKNHTDYRPEIKFFSNNVKWDETEQWGDIEQFYLFDGNSPITLTSITAMSKEKVFVFDKNGHLEFLLPIRKFSRFPYTSMIFNLFFA